MSRRGSPSGKNYKASKSMRERMDYAHTRLSEEFYAKKKPFSLRTKHDLSREQVRKLPSTVSSKGRQPSMPKMPWDKEPS
jgi:hypothetical protein